MQFPVFKSKVKGLRKTFDLTSPQEIRKYFELKTGQEIKELN